MTVYVYIHKDIYVYIYLFDDCDCDLLDPARSKNAFNAMADCWVGDVDVDPRPAWTHELWESSVCAFTPTHEKPPYLYQGPSRTMAFQLLPILTVARA